MCQMRVSMVDEGGERLIMENVTRLQVSADGVEVSALFDAPSKIDAVFIQAVDMLGGKVLLGKKPE